MFYALQLPAWTDHAVTQYALGLRDDGEFAKRRGVVPALVGGAVAAVLLVAIWEVLRGAGVVIRLSYSMGSGGPARLVVLFLPLPIGLIAGFAVGFAGAGRLRRHAMLRDLCHGALDRRETLQAYVVGLAAEALIYLACLTQAIVCLAWMDSQFFGGISPFFLLGFMAVNLLCGGSLALDYGLSLGFAAGLERTPVAVAYLYRLPVAVLETLAGLVLGLGIGGLAWLAHRTERLGAHLQQAFATALDDDAGAA